MSAQQEAWARGVRRAASMLVLLATDEHVIVLTDPSTHALLFDIWRETIHEMYRADARYHCEQWCWLRLTETQQRERFTGALSFHEFLRIIAAGLEAVTTCAHA